MGFPFLAWIGPDRCVSARFLGVAARAVCGSALTLCLAGCGISASQVHITAKQAAYPMSLTSVLPDPQGRILSKPADLEETTLFELYENRYTTAYGAAGGELDISGEVNRQVREAGGEGITDLNISATPCRHNAFAFLSFLPFWPSCMDVTIRGEIVRRKRTVAR